ncbi:glycosyltransferase family 4 protein [Alteromonas sp. 1_MG-2023]|uniref:glycosyltransferase family 4 protein n=1 Tax=Alteromonas sp. 1_MG-2023 TaxID=3062669 RepID=UPI0026E3AA6D|nr:glycosyltransferase family 4 protein [Alteromonas sp. 1_MG-2023]MDO6567506.1 glycosyltransferase family 4 protein [Alteromonas sp. 1_MG-2023]
MPHVCVIGTRGVPHFVGGVETICQKLYPLILMAKPSYKITLITRLPYKSQERYQYEKVNVKVIKALKISGFETFFHTFIALCYARIFIHPQIIHLHGIGPGFFSLFSRLLGFKTVVTHHSPDYKRPKWKWYAKLILKMGELFTVLFASRIICVSSSVKEELDVRFPFLLRKRVVIRNAGSLLEKPAQIKQDALLKELGLESKQYILAVGRLDATKGFDNLIDAFLALKSTKFKLVIVGDNYITNDYVRKITQHRSESIIFAGAHTGENLATIYRNAALLVNPSFMEGYCLVVAEGLSANTPIVASDIPAHREFKLNEESYVKKGDVPALTEKLSAGDYSIYRSTSAELLQSNNTWEKNAHEHLKLFNSMI